MYRLKEITESFSTLVGWAQSYNPATFIDSALTASDSGLTYQGAHPLLTLDTLASVIPDTWGLQYPEWNMLLAYEAGRKVKHKGIVWEALRESVGMEPPSSDFNGDYSATEFGGEYWRPYNELSDFVKRITTNSIASVVQNFITGKSLARQSKSLLQRMALFDGAGRFNSLVMLQGDMCGFRITPARSMGVTAKIERIGLQMYGASGTVRVYLFHSSSPEPVYTAECEITGKKGLFQWFDVKDWYLPYSGDNAPGGSWFLCYSQTELPVGMSAINFARDWSRPPCGSCNKGNADAWRELCKYVECMPFKAAPAENGLWDSSESITTPGNNYGINFEISVGCDLTDFIISQRMMFANVLQKQVAYDALRTIAMNPNVRVNRTQVNADRANVLYELDGNPQGRAAGLGKELRDAYKALSLDTKGIDRICLTCGERGVSYGAI